MKKFIAVAAILSVMFLGTGTSQALIGMPDAVPGTDILVPFFLVSMTAPDCLDPGCECVGNDNTLITLTEVKGVDPTNMEYWVMDKDSDVVGDGTISLTGFDVLPTDGLEIAMSVASMPRKQLRIDLDGNGLFDHWVGYVYYFNLSTLINNVIAHAYQVALPEGMAASYIPASMEFNNALDPARQIGFFGVEAFSANALWSGKNILATGVAPGADATIFRLMPRYYIHDADSHTYLIIWTDQIWTGIPAPGTLDVIFYDEEENDKTGPLPIEHELNIIDLGGWLPPVFGPFPHRGWIDIFTPDTFGAGWFTDLNGNLIDDGAERCWLGYSLQQAVGAAAETWDVIHEVHRETDDL